ncbi:hypothetical protein CH249_17280 [Rhodococcus sp. 05-2255-3B1]|uniref:SIMPL domain-containing protein n=1 Tax=unclassified Rhodococcus (in: high G+C Gram-positive bacteria) TaxID=192944 RepID=UPI000B9A2E69|nr:MULTISPECIES: SIMPL domain-containing protein [unclassified Rhodococcus (in: high G+C Gram-positive bacteria)]OZE08590.1 hypothetical protein CH249_17280 [Rhodococcus sp. 05-2255-3B1]OZE15743.1 hypothetical protein CH250_03200 [Rhodococcus sp. 05-2255-3C]OZE22787.1 hypothetical protein CH255_05410 [Rhodococcus sp. 05-2255-2A2]
MSPEALDITVVGHGAATYPPEQCTLALTVRTDGRTAESASEPAQQLVRELTRLVEPLYNSDGGPIDRWSVDQVRHSRHRPFNHDGEQLPYVYQAEASVEVQFSQLDLVDAFVYAAASALEGVSIDHFDWDLTESSRTAHTLAVRELAVRDAVSKAEAYASSLGRSGVHAVAVADPGLLPGFAESGGPESSARMFAAKSAPTGFALKPENITISASVHARFTAS